LTSGTSFTVPDDWNNAANTIEAIGGGGSGGAQNQVSPINTLATGGGGGAYSSVTNLSLVPGSPVSYNGGAGGASVRTPDNGVAGQGIPGGDTWFSSTSTVLAKGGSGGAAGTGGSLSGGAGGPASGSIGFVKTSGGRGGNVAPVLENTIAN